MTSMQDRQKTLTIEQLRQRYNLDDIGKTKKAIQLVKETLNKTETELNQFVSSTTKNLKELQDQVDGNITTWFFNGIPTTENEPAKNWTTEKDKANHIGDLYYDQDTGYAYRWAYEENSYAWSKIVDADVVKALAVANSAQDTADSKRRVFVAQPKPPYDIGDIWLKEDSELYRCRCARIKEDKFNISDWIIATKYTDDTVALETKGELNQFKTEVKENYTSNATFETTVNSIKGKVEETYTYTTTVENEVKDISKTKENIIDENNLYLKEALESNALEYSIDGKCEQATRSGKNLANIKAGTYSLNGITLTINNGEILLNGTATAAVTFTGIGEFLYKTGKTYSGTFIYESGSCTDYGAGLYLSNSSTSNVNIGGGAGFRQNQSRTFNITSKTEDIQEYFYIVVNKNTIINNYRIKIQIVEGTTADYNFEQYGASPSPDYPSEIKTIKGIRNLFDGVLFNGYLNEGLVADSKWKTTDYIEVKSNTTYITSYLKNTTRVLYEEYTSKDVSSRISARKETTPKTAITTQNTTKYIRFSFNDNSLTDKEIMIEQGSVAHSYVPYGTYEKIKVTGKNLIKNTNVPTNNSDYWRAYSTFDESTGTLTRSTSTTTESFITYLIDGMKSNTTYTLSCLAKSNGYVKSMDMYMYALGAIGLKSKGNISLTTDFKKYTFTFTTDENIDYSRRSIIRFDNNGSTTSGTVATLTIKDVMLCEGTNDDYEPYKEKEVLIDLAKENLFDDSNLINHTGGMISEVLTLEPNTFYTFESNIPKTYGVTSAFIFFNSGNTAYTVTDTTGVWNGQTRTVKSDNNGNVCVSYRHQNDTPFNNYYYKIYEGYSPYHELNSIGDTKDKLEIINGVADIQKRIGKIVLNGSENWQVWSTTHGNKRFAIDLSNIILKPSATTIKANILCSHYQVETADENYTDIEGICIQPSGWLAIYDSRYNTTDKLTEFKTELQSNPVTVYYELADPEIITLPNTNIPLYEGVNHVTLVEDLETTTSIKYLRKTPISGEYALNQDLNKTNSNLADTNNQLSQAQSDIDNTKTNLNNNYYNKEQVDSINSTTTQNITQIRNTMEQNITSTNASISKIQEEITNGVSKVTTTTGTFDENGLNISKSGQQMSSTLDWDGLEVVRDKGKATETEVLTVRSAGVEAENMTVRNFFIEKPIRIEKCKSITDSTKVGLGFFWIGE